MQNIDVSRWFRSTTASVLAVALGACSLEVERDSGPEPTASVAYVEVQDVAVELAEHPVFDGVSNAAYRRVDRVLETFGSLSAMQRTTVKNRLTACSGGDPKPCTDELALLGFNASLSSQESAWMSELLADTDLGQLDLEERREAFLEAQQLRDVATGHASWDDLVPPIVDGQPCGNACRAAFMAEFADPHADFLAAMSSFVSASAWQNDAFAIGGAGQPAPIPTGGGGPPVDDGVISIAILAVLAIITYCAAHDCTPDAPEDQECSHDNECDNDEYCHKGFLGAGRNECRPARSLDLSCGRDAECLSDCCKGGFIGIGKECKPASECN